MERDIQRVNGYSDPRFSSKILRQHGAFLVDGEPYAVEITGRDSAIIYGARKELYSAVIDTFRFYARHISRFYTNADELIMEFLPPELFSVKLEAIQPSQFYVDMEKLAAVRDFIHSTEDIIIPVTPNGERYISQDGHTRLAVAVERRIDKALAFTAEENVCLYHFAREAQNRGVFSPYDLKAIPHEEYEIKWNQFCEDYFARQGEEKP